MFRGKPPISYVFYLPFGAFIVLGMAGKSLGLILFVMGILFAFSAWAWWQS